MKDEPNLTPAERVAKMQGWILEYRAKATEAAQLLGVPPELKYAVLAGLRPNFENTDVPIAQARSGPDLSVMPADLGWVHVYPPSLAGPASYTWTTLGGDRESTQPDPRVSAADVVTDMRLSAEGWMLKASGDPEDGTTWLELTHDDRPVQARWEVNMLRPTTRTATSDAFGQIHLPDVPYATFRKECLVVREDGTLPITVVLP